MHLSPERSSEKSPKSTHEAQQDVGNNSGLVAGQISEGIANNISGSNVYFVDSDGIALDQKSLSKKPVIPSLLPYLPDRTDQEFTLSLAIQRWQSQSKRQPLVCLIHGDELQSHDKFLERLRKVSLPRLLNLDLKQTSIKEHHLTWPSTLKKLEQLSARLTKNLGDSVENNSYASVEDVNKTFGKHPGPVIVHLHLLTDDWCRLGPGLLHKILDFWQQWPELGVNQTLIVCIFITYQLKRPKPKRKHWWLINPFIWLKGFLKCRRCHKLNCEITEQLGTLNESEFREFSNFTGTVLPQLNNVNRNHVEDWVRCPETRKFAGEAVLEKLMNDVGELFEHTETIPMKEVACKLDEFLVNRLS